MDFNFELKEVERPIIANLSIPVSMEMRQAIQEIKKSKDNNSRLVNDLARQFFAQLIEQYRSGAFEAQSVTDLGKILK